MFKGFRLVARIVLILAIMWFPMGVNRESLWEAIAADPASGSLVNCEIQRGPCTQELAGMAVTLDILPRPVKAMKDLKFQVTLSGGKPTAAPYIDLGMPGMNMGPNRVELRGVSDNVYEGQGILVRCPSGRRTWKATVTLPEVGKVEFVFDVIY
ncbi:MAG: hypothetical protein H6Q48_2519 [Deltaproteobacteria bacterium]|nr:hypothetical protein [Deltaproteobacteria bacterium]